MSFKVTVQPSGHTFSAEPHESILDAAMRQAVDLPYGCRNGVCGSCAGYVMSGQIKYSSRPSALTVDLEAQDRPCFAWPWHNQIW